LPVDTRADGEQWRARIDGAKKVDEQLLKDRDQVKNFGRSDGPWGRIRDNLKDSAEHTYDYFHRKLEETQRACERLVLGEHNPDVERAVEQMRRDTGEAENSYRNLRDEFRRWKGDVDQLREFTKQDVEEIRQAYCRAEDATERSDLDAVKEIADRWASRLNSLYGSITGEGDRIKSHADALVSKGRAPKAGPKVKEAIDGILASIAKLRDSELQGANNPRLKAQAAYGVAEHDRRQSGCKGKELLIKSTYCENPN